MYLDFSKGYKDVYILLSKPIGMLYLKNVHFIVYKLYFNKIDFTKASHGLREDICNSR